MVYCSLFCVAVGDADSGMGIADGCQTTGAKEGYGCCVGIGRVGGNVLSTVGDEMLIDGEYGGISSRRIEVCEERSSDIAPSRKAPCRLATAKIRKRADNRKRKQAVRSLLIHTGDSRIHSGTYPEGRDGNSSLHGKNPI